MIRVELNEGTYVRFAGRENGLPLLFLHAFGDSGHCYEKLLTSSLLEHYRLIAVDLWGFGSSPRRPEVRTVTDYSGALKTLLHGICSNQPAGLIGHSIAGSMAVEIAARAGGLVRGVFSIEGNLTPDDAMFTGKAADFDDPDTFKKSFLDDIWELGKDSDELRHYYSAARLANPRSMWNLGRDAKQISANNKLGEAFQKLSVPKIYYWSKSSTPQNTQDWIQHSAIPNEMYTDAGHWPMISKPESTARSIAKFFDRLCAQSN